MTEMENNSDELFQITFGNVCILIKLFIFSAFTKTNTI